MECNAKEASCPYAVDSVDSVVHPVHPVHPVDLVSELELAAAVQRRLVKEEDIRREMWSVSP